MKKTLLTVAAASLALGLFGCSEPPANTPATPAPATTGGVVMTATPVVNGTPSPAVTVTATPGDATSAPMTGTPMPGGTETPAPAPDATGTPMPTATP